MVVATLFGANLGVIPISLSLLLLVYLTVGVLVGLLILTCGRFLECINQMSEDLSELKHLNRNMAEAMANAAAKNSAIGLESDS